MFKDNVFRPTQPLTLAAKEGYRTFFGVVCPWLCINLMYYVYIHCLYAFYISKDSSLFVIYLSRV